jgi:hypothetical protein
MARLGAPENIALFYSDNIDSLGAFFALIEVELHRLVLIQAAEPVTLDTCVVDEHVLTFFGRHETITFGRVEPFDFAFHREKISNKIRFDGAKKSKSY